MIRLFEAFAGYGTSSFALKQLGVEFELVGFSEVDKYAVKCFVQNHGGKNFGDITKIDWSCVPDFDLLTGGFPCQAFSTAGKQLGEQDSRGVLGLELTRALIEKQPKYFLFENVKGFMSKRFTETREKFIHSWEDAGYKVVFKVLNTKDFGVPQNRERVWFVGIRKDIQKNFEFPTAFELKLKLKDVLEPNVEEKYFLSQEQVEKLFKHLKNQKDKGNSFGVDALPMDVDNCSRTLSARDYKSPKCVSIYRHSFKGFKGYEDVSVSLKSSEGSGNQALVIDRSKCVCNEGKVCSVCCEVCGNYKDECDCKIELKELTKDVSQAMRVFSDEGTACTLRGLGGGMGAKTGLYALGCALRGRSKNEDGSWNLNFESNKEECSNALTKVQKDSLVSISLYPRSGNPKQGGTGTLVKSDGSSYCLDSGNCQAIVQNRVRRLTPKECFRLQGFLNDEVNLEGLSDTQKYKLAGNGQSVNVVKLLLKELF